MTMTKLLSFKIVALLSLLGTAAWAQSAVEADEKWNLVWADEFDGETVDLTKWSFEDDCWGGGN